MTNQVNDSVKSAVGIVEEAKKETVLKILNKMDILQAQDLSKEKVEVPEWGGCVFVRTMSGIERDEFESFVQSKTDQKGGLDTKGMRVELLRLTLVNEDGSLMFSKEELTALSGKSSIALERLFKESQKVNGMGEKELAEIRKN